nr:ABC transporter transmembrane domain-containing protein [Oscillospiraceae bacterium]
MREQKHNPGEVPAGFEHTQTSEASYRKVEQKKTQQMEFGPRGGPGRNMGQTIEKPKAVQKTISRLLKYFENEKKLLWLLVISVVAATLASLAAPAMQGDAIDRITKLEWSGFGQLLIVLLIVYFVYTGCTLAQMLISAHLSQRIVQKMRHDLFRKIDNLPIKYLDTHSNGDVMSRMTNDVENISNTVSQSMSSLISGILTILGTIAIMSWYCWQLTLITMA